MQGLAIATVFAFALLQVAISADSNNLDEFGPPETVAPLLSLIEKTLSDFSFPVDDAQPLIVTLDVPPEVNDDDKTSQFVSIHGEVKDANPLDSGIPENLNPEAVFEPFLNLIHNSLLNMPPPNPQAANTFLPLNSPRSNDEKINLRTIDYIPGGMRVKVLHKTFAPPTQTIVATGNINGRNVNQFQQKQMYSTHDFAIVQSPKKEDAFAKLEEKSTKLEEKSAKLEEKPAKLEDPFAKLEDPFAKLEDPIAKLKDSLAKLEDSVAKLEDPFAKLEDPFAQLEGKSARAKDDLPDPIAIHKDLADNLKTLVKMTDDYKYDIPDVLSLNDSP